MEGGQLRCGFPRGTEAAGRGGPVGAHGGQTGGRGRVRSPTRQRCPALGCGSCTACLLFQPKGIMLEAGGGDGGPGAGGASPGQS